MVEMATVVARRQEGMTRYLRLSVLGVILLDLALIGGQVLLYRPFLAQKNAFTYVLEPVAALWAYAGVTVWVTRAAGLERRIALREGTIIGLIGGALFAINLASETFLDLAAPASLLATAPFFLGTFALWGVAGYRAARRTGSVPLGGLAAIWAAMCTILITITFGFVLSYTALPRLQQILATSPEYARSGWTDLRAFAVANQFDAAFSHLLEAVIIAAMMGAVGSLVGAQVARRRVRGEARRGEVMRTSPSASAQTSPRRSLSATHTARPTRRRNASADVGDSHYSPCRWEGNSRDYAR